MSKNDERVYVYPDPGVWGHDDRMFKRAYFAGQALIGLLANPKNRRDATFGDMARDAWDFADAMIATEGEDQCH